MTCIDTTEYVRIKLAEHRKLGDHPLLILKQFLMHRKHLLEECHVTLGKMIIKSPDKHVVTGHVTDGDNAPHVFGIRDLLNSFVHKVAKVAQANVSAGKRAMSHVCWLFAEGFGCWELWLLGAFWLVKIQEQLMCFMPSWGTGVK
ncbi:hypothetical protein FR483_n378R [Paramecium bursaria Chlorella virus FR483]|uniref:Uncharacterized protein n378R n=1 Tax=Paramecium bursaria Chlorella virus FR483 TaxID=399781 RepID=A7J782_PBCVF|nr:hypothetical protein FR483_n378R [Paramecium bursaria Chlorella virus FR483]ABT15663.1 hypothetical protein FR483_n378R [Paramecium bursaria Chlorella virus FR483]